MDRKKAFRLRQAAPRYSPFCARSFLCGIDISHCGAKIKSLTDVTTEALNKIQLRFRFNLFGTVLKCIFLANCTMASRVPASFLSSEIPSMKMRSIFGMTNIGE
nr:MULTISPECIES: hypothetical protein [Telluria group]